MKIGRINRRLAIKLLVSVGLIGILLWLFYRKPFRRFEFDINDLTRQKPIIDHLAETILPETDTPGAMMAGVGDFIINMIANCSMPEEQYHFMKGLKSVQHHCLNKYGVSFEQCGMTNKIAVIEHFERKSSWGVAILDKIRNKLFGIPFISQLKILTVQGYCTSEIGATKALAYDYIPIRYDPCTKLGVNQKSWATK